MSELVYRMWQRDPHSVDDEIVALKAERDELRARLSRVLGWFWQEGHPGRSCLRTGWVNAEVIAEMRREVDS